MLDLGPVSVGLRDLYILLLWVGVGFLCTFIPGHRSLLLAAGLVVVVQLIPIIFFVNPPERAVGVPALQFFRFGADLDTFFGPVIIPLAGALFGALLGEFALPAEEEDEA